MSQSSKTKKLLRDQILSFGPDSHDFSVFELCSTKFWGLVVLKFFHRCQNRWTKVYQFQENRDQSSKIDHLITFLFLNFGSQNFGDL